MCVLPNLDMLTIQEITERLRNHYIGGSEGASASVSGHKIRHRSEPAHVRTLTSSHDAAYSDVLLQRQEPGIEQLPSPRAKHTVLLPVPHDMCCEDDGEDEYELSAVNGTADTLACSPGVCPPSKRHCRSLSIPSDSYTSVDDWLASSDLPRPVALRPIARAAAAATVPTPAAFAGSFYPASLSSPVPRPASVASSGFFDGASSSSASSLCWGAGVSSSGGYQPTAAMTAAASSDSLACIVAPRARLLTGDSHYARHPLNIAGGSKQAVYAATAAASSATAAACVQSAKSMPSVGSADGIGAFSAPSSPKHRRPQRCRSQPCDLQCDQASGGASLKRRREDDRPCLNFAKMTETAYERLSSERFSRFKASVMTVNKLAGLHHSTNLDSLHCSAAAGSMYTHRPPAQQPCAESETIYQPLQTIACSPPEGCVAWVVAPPSSFVETVLSACSSDRHTAVSSESKHGCSPILADGSYEKSSFESGEAECNERGDSDDEYDCGSGNSSGGSSADSEYVDAPGEPLMCYLSTSAGDLDLDEIELH